MGQQWLDGYSADVEIYILFEGRTYDVAQIGNGSLILRDPTPIPANTDVTLIICIDGRETKETIHLAERADSPEVAVPFF